MSKPPFCDAPHPRAADAIAIRNSPVNDPDRLAALRRTGLLDSPASRSFDRLTRLASLLLRAPAAIISLVDERRQFLKSQVGLPEPWATSREVPLSHSFCRHVVENGMPLIIDDALIHELVRDNPAVAEMRIAAYAGIPLQTADGHVLGSLCVIDHQPRARSRAAEPRRCARSTNQSDGACTPAHRRRERQTFPHHAWLQGESHRDQRRRRSKRAG